MGQTYTGLSGKTKDDFGHGQARFVTYMNVFSNPISNPEMTEPIEIDPKQNEVEVGDVFFTTSSETPEEVGMSSILLEKRGKTYLNSFCFGFRPSEKIDSYYLAYMLRSESTRAKIILLAQGISRYNISKNKVMEIAVSLPSLDEQKMIGQYFSQLDNLITLHQRQPFLHSTPDISLSVRLIHPFYTSSWEQRKFDEVFDCTVPNNTLSRAELSYDEGTVLNVHYGDVLIKYGSVLDVQKDDIPRIPHRCREDFNGALLQDGDVIIADTAEDETTGKACEIGNLQGSAIVSGLHTMVCRPRNRMALGYLGYYLNSNAYHHQLLPLMQGIKVLSLSRSNIQKTSVSYPIAVKEQQLIAYYFSQLDNLITLHQRKFEKLTNVKKSMLEKMFPQNGSSYPEIRFKGFTDPWEQRKLGELVDVCSGRDYKHLSEGTIPVYGTGGYMLSVNDALSYDRDAIGIGRKGTIDRPYILKAPFWTVDTLFYAIPREKVDLNYAFDIFQNIDWKKKDESTGVPSLSKTAINDIDVLAPKHDEQQIIGQFFAAIDNLITLHQRELEKLQNIKKSMLEKMFV